jgi:hypothetical protein
VHGVPEIPETVGDVFTHFILINCKFYLSLCDTYFWRLTVFKKLKQTCGDGESYKIQPTWAEYSRPKTFGHVQSYSAFFPD